MHMARAHGPCTWPVVLGLLAAETWWWGASGRVHGPPSSASSATSPSYQNR
eukprot:CAMPEP_0174743568 /NCGR_PEP_ID=MMETSP1094-20130205/81977_1 /TAXON_ID=156173 /ORGANISM="Chrysochromulina brevifilum, Strain UTEX LB 985" /LENGTH=50 /DNA_ID=CAMNT_0015947805 /DNA_START=122 /DNA_END=270 /DNA_ORIENTATION=-